MKWVKCHRIPKRPKKFLCAHTVQRVSVYPLSKTLTGEEGRLIHFDLVSVDRAARWEAGVCCPFHPLHLAAFPRVFACGWIERVRSSKRFCAGPPWMLFRSTWYYMSGEYPEHSILWNGFRFSGPSFLLFLAGFLSRSPTQSFVDSNLTCLSASLFSSKFCVDCIHHYGENHLLSCHVSESVDILWCCCCAVRTIKATDRSIFHWSEWTSYLD